MPLAGCQPVNQKPVLAPFDAWNYSDVRLLDPIDTIVPNHELIALYTKNGTQYFQIRMDFLSLDSLVDQDIYIPIDTNPGGVDQIILQTKGIISVDFNWDYLIIIPASGAIEVVNSQYSKLQDIELFVLLDQEQDKLVVSLLRNKISAISNLTEIQIFITEPEEKYVVDSTDPVSIDAISPTRAEISFAFWNTFHSATPAETLRSWAGAHSGLISSRHGIKYLLQAADASKYPIFLADFNNPKTMAAMDYLGVLPWIRNLMSNGIIISPHKINIYHKNLEFINDYFDSFEINKYNIGVNDYANNIVKYRRMYRSPDRNN